MKAFSTFKSEAWCIDLAYIDKLAKVNIVVKYPLARQDLFDRTVVAKRVRTRNFRETVPAFLTMITKKTDPKNLGSTRQQKILERMKNFAKLIEYEVTLQ